jgi:glucose-6-phosphate 1-dehydrogenase
MDGLGGRGLPEVFNTKMRSLSGLLLDCMTGDQMLFMRQDSVLLSWQLMQPVLDYWDQQNKTLFIYPAGILNIKHADEWINKDGLKWRAL